jgi:carboxyl-terminal processing protease
VLLVPLTFAGAHSAPGGGVNPEEASPTKSRIIDGFSKAVFLARDNYAGQIDFERLVKGSILGMLHTLDPHSSYMDRKEWEAFHNEQRSRYSGIGSTIGQRNSKVYILSPFAGTPAHRAGIRFGDHILEINGESTEGWTSLQVSNKLIGPEGTPVRVKVGRLGLSQPLEFRLIRGTVPLPSITNYYMVDKNVGYIHLARGFNTTSFEEMRSALRDLREQGMTSLILDLRGNRGGLVDQAWRVANLFLMRGQKILSMRGRPTVFQDRDLFAFNQQPDDYPLVVLINRGSASAAEIVAGALQDHDRARIVGESSFGKGLVQTVFQLSDGSGLTLTTGKYYTPSGRLIQRDYANKSFYEYLFRRESQSNPRGEERHTDSGRLVYGGGGITPDLEVRTAASELELSRIWLEPVFHFARALVSGQIQGFPEFRIDRTVDHTGRLAPNDYVVNDKVLAAFKNFVRTQKEFGGNESRIDQDSAFLKRQIRYDVATAAFGQEAAAQVILEGDIQMQKALGEIPKAKLMAEDARRAWMASRSGSGRNE